MGVCTTFTFLNANDPKYVAARDGTAKQRDQREAEHNDCELQPGAEVEHDEDAIEETDHEYGGWLIDLSRVPTGATHLLVSRG